MADKLWRCRCRKFNLPGTSVCAWCGTEFVGQGENNPEVPQVATRFESVVDNEITSISNLAPQEKLNFGTFFAVAVIVISIVGQILFLIFSYSNRNAYFGGMGTLSVLLIFIPAVVVPGAIAALSLFLAGIVQLIFDRSKVRWKIFLVSIIGLITPFIAWSLLQSLN